MWRYTALLIIVLNTGCTSISSSVLSRTPDNSGWMVHKKIKGVPVRLKVPTHMRVNIIEIKLLGVVTTSDGTPTITSIAPLDRPLYRIDHEIIKTDKIFFVDMKRPAAGTIDASVKFNAEAEYPTEWNYKVKDETLLKSADLVKAIAPNIFAVPGSQSMGFGSGQVFDIKDGVREVESLVATDVFELDSPCFEAEVRGFIEAHLNCGHHCTAGDIGAAPPPTPMPASGGATTLPTAQPVPPTPAAPAGQAKAGRPRQESDVLSTAARPARSRGARVVVTDDE